MCLGLWLAINGVSAELLRRLLSAGLSRYEPNPLEALEAAEHAAP